MYSFSVLLLDTCLFSSQRFIYMMKSWGLGIVLFIIAVFGLSFPWREIHFHVWKASKTFEKLDCGFESLWSKVWHKSENLSCSCCVLTFICLQNMDHLLLSSINFRMISSTLPQMYSLYVLERYFKKCWGWWKKYMWQ